MPELQQVVRVVALRKGKLKPVEFRLRPDEIGLSLFEYTDRATADLVVEAFKSMGKQGDLALALLQTDDLQALGLNLTRTKGATGRPEIDATHVEARLPLLLRISLFLRGIKAYDYFNEHLSLRLCDMARL